MDEFVEAFNDFQELMLSVKANPKKYTSKQIVDKFDELGLFDAF